MNTEIVSNSLQGSKPVPFEDISEARLLLARERDQRIRDLEKGQLATWSEMGELCKLISDEGDWKILGFQSFNRWLLNAAPYSRSAMYAAMAILDGLDGVETKDLREMPIGSAKVLAAVPKRSRTPKMIAAAKRAPKEFKALVQDKFPDLHIETSIKRSFEFARSQEKIIDGAIAMAAIIESGEWTDDEIPDAEALTCICEDYLDRHRPTYEKIKSMAK